MAHFKTLKINNVNDGGEHTLNLKRIALYKNTKNFTNNSNNVNSGCILSVKKNGETYRPSVNVNRDGCLVSSSNYDLLLNITKGKYLDYFKCNNDFSYSLVGNINDGNLFSVDNGTFPQCYAHRTSDISGQNNIIIDTNYKTVFSEPGISLVQTPNNCNNNFDIESLQDNMNNNLNNSNNSNNTYNNMLGKQTVYENFKYPMRFKI